MTKKRIPIPAHVCAALLAVFACPNLLVGQHLETDSDPDARQVPIQPRVLADGNYAQRQRATWEMWRGRDVSRQAVQDASRNSDPEVAERAAWILRQWRSGALPGVGKPPASLLLDRSSVSALATVLEQGAFDAVLVAVEESAGTIEFDQIKRRVAQSLTQRFPIFVDKAFADGTEFDLLKLLDAVAVDRNLATSSRDLKQRLNIATNHSGLGESFPLPADSATLPADSGQLPTAAEMWTETERSVCLAQFAMLSGDVDQSIDLAAQTGDTVLVRIARMLGDRWAELADTAFEQAESAETPLERTEAYAWGLAGASRVGNQAQIAEATEQLLTAVPNDDTLSPELIQEIKDLRWRALAMHNNLDQAIEVLAIDAPAAAAKLACSSSRCLQSAELCGYDLQRIELDLDQWIDDAFEEQATLAVGELAPSMERLYSLARLLIDIGDHDNAWRIYRRLTPRQIIVSRYGHSMRERTLSEIGLVNRLDWMCDLAVRDGDSAVTTTTRRIIAHVLKTDSGAFKTVLDRIKMVKPRNDFRDRFRLTFQLFRAKPPANFDVDKDFQKLFDALVHYPIVSRVGSRTVQTERVALDLELIDLFIRNEQVQLAREGLAVLVREGNVDAMIALANSEMEQGNSLAAEALWRRVAIQAAQFKPANAVVTVDHGLAYSKSVIGQWISAKRAGHSDAADELETRIRLILTSPSLQLRKGVADFLRQCNQYEFAVEVLRELVVLTSFGGADAPDFFDVAVAYVGAIDDLKDSDPHALERLQIDPRESVKWSDLAVIDILKSQRYEDTAFVSVPLSVRKTFLQHAIDAKDPASAERAIAEIESYDRINIDFGERMLPKLRSAGMEQLADAAFDRLVDAAVEHVNQFPLDATSLNNLAWTAAMNERRLEEALQLSERAVMLEPDSVVYRDTLAEVLHLLGRTEEALAIESACLLDEPDEWHLHEQIDKYQRILSYSATP